MTTEEIFTRDITDTKNACEHYLDKVNRAVTSDVHERNRHRGNLDYDIRLCDKALKEYIPDENWKLARRVEIDTNYHVGLAATWLVSIAITTGEKE